MRSQISLLSSVIQCHSHTNVALRLWSAVGNKCLSLFLPKVTAPTCVSVAETFSPWTMVSAKFRISSQLSVPFGLLSRILPEQSMTSATSSLQSVRQKFRKLVSPRDYPRSLPFVCLPLIIHNEQLLTTLYLSYYRLSSQCMVILSLVTSSSLLVVAVAVTAAWLLELNIQIHRLCDRVHYVPLRLYYFTFIQTQPKRHTYLTSPTNQTLVPCFRFACLCATNKIPHAMFLVPLLVQLYKLQLGWSYSCQSRNTKGPLPGVSTGVDVSHWITRHVWLSSRSRISANLLKSVT